MIDLFGTGVVRVFPEFAQLQVVDLLHPAGHSPLVERRRAGLITSRARMVAALFAVLTPLWVVVDYLFFPWPLWGGLAAGRLVASVAFAGLALAFRRAETMREARRALVLLLLVPTLFYLFSHPMLGYFETEGLAAVLAAGYAYLPFVMVAGLAVFPLTAIEGGLFAAPMVLSVLVVAVLQEGVADWTGYVGIVWLLLLIAVVATFSGMSQLHFMIALVAQASRDGVTRAFNRRIGEELLELQFYHAQRQNAALALAFIDIDHFKAINDTWGHEEGDRMLRQAAEAMRTVFRRGDVVVRWGGEEFLVVMPNTDVANAATAIARLWKVGLGQRPEGKPLTASVGLAERIVDQAPAWPQLVELADQRMYAAKQGGRDRCIGPGDQRIA
jgi:diguanylate cyclase (GGDEF)-like protein